VGSHETACGYIRIAEGWAQLKPHLAEDRGIGIRRALAILRGPSRGPRGGNGGTADGVITNGVPANGTAPEPTSGQRLLYALDLVEPGLGKARAEEGTDRFLFRGGGVQACNGELCCRAPTGLADSVTGSVDANARDVLSKTFADQDVEITAGAGWLTVRWSRGGTATFTLRPRNDVLICNPEKSWQVLKYLEDEHGLEPVPVVHFGTPLKWVERHVEAGYKMLGLGGLGQEATVGPYRQWADRVFTSLCPAPSHLPVVRTHGFAMTAYDLVTRYPWFSVNSATWARVGSNGGIMVPHKRGRRFTFDIKPYQIAVSEESPASKKFGAHYKTLPADVQAEVREWLELIKVPLGRGKKGDPDVQWGVTNRHVERKIANLLFFERLRESLPDYPWPFKVATKIRRMF
jgi:hypothetical protein